MTTTDQTLEATVASLLERVTALEARFAAHDLETAEDRAEREGRNGDAEWRRVQLARPPQIDPRERERHELRRSREALLPWAEWLRKIEAELRVELSALGDEEPRGNDMLWRRKREDVTDTLRQVHVGVGVEAAGNLYALADRDGMRAQLVNPSLPNGLRRVEARLAEIEAKLETLS